MVDFSNIVQTPEIRAIVQEGYLERAFHDALFPAMIFRGDVVAQPWPAGVGDTYIASAPGLIRPNGRPLRPGVDPEPVSYPIEQWEAQLNTYASTIDTNIPTSVQAIVDLLLRNSHQLGLQAAQTLNRLVRNRFYNAAESGLTVANGLGAASTSLVVKRLNGFTRSRNPNLTNGSRVRFSAVSSSNPLSISIAGTTRNVIGFTPATAGDEIGPGTLLLDAAHTWADRDYVQAIDRSEMVFVGGGNKVDDLGVTDLPRLQDIRNCVMRLRRNNIPMHPDGNYHAHLGPVSLTALMADTEIQRMLTGRPENYMYTDFVVGKMLGVIFVDNNEVPTKLTVEPLDGVTFSLDDAFAPELTNNGAANGMEVHRILFTGFGGIYEYYQDPALFITEAGMVGKMGEVQVSNNGIEVHADRVKLIMRAPLNRLQDMVATSWRFDGDWPQRTDAATGTAARYKRSITLAHGFDS
jgi:hypothetical protein